jgi:hypothetical protein
MKTCTRCNNDKPLSDYQIDKRREGDSKYQQPCKDCRNAYNRTKRRINTANNKLPYCDLKHVAGYKEFTEEQKKFTEARILLERAINNSSNVFVQGEHQRMIIGCSACKHIQILPEVLSGKVLLGIIETYEDYHNTCSRT